MMNRHKDISIDISKVLSTPIQDPIPPEVVREIITQPPFLPVSGAFNIRDISISPYIREGLLYRSGALGHITPAGKVDLVQKYGIRTIFDLRSLAERNKRPSPEIEGIETRWIPSTVGAKVLSLNSEELKFYAEGDGEKGYMRMYSNILDSYQNAFRDVFIFLRDNKDGGALFHCSAGKDRTGVLAALILGLAGAPDSAIAHDYALTRIGIETAREQLMVLFKEQTGMDFDQPGFAEMAAIKGKTMHYFLKMMKEKWGGAEGYVKEELGLTDIDIQSIRDHLRGN